MVDINDNSNDGKRKRKHDSHDKTKQNHDNDHSKNKHNVGIEGDGNTVVVENHYSLFGKRGNKNKVGGNGNSLTANIGGGEQQVDNTPEPPKETMFQQEAREILEARKFELAEAEIKAQIRKINLSGITTDGVSMNASHTGGMSSPATEHVLLSKTDGKIVC